MVDIEKPEAKNGTGGVLIHCKIKVLPMGPAGPFVLQGHMVAMEKTGPEIVGHMTLQADTLPLAEHGLRGWREAFAAAMKSLMEEVEAQKLMTQHSAETVRRINQTKGGGS